MEEERKSFSEVVKTAIAAKDIKPAELARLTGYSAQYISDLIAGKRRWNEESIGKVCKEIGVSIDFSPISPDTVAETTQEG